MHRRLSLYALSSLLVLLAACGGTDTIAPPQPEYFTATGDFWNFVVLDGSLDTRITVHQGEQFMPADQVLPGGGATARNLTLTAESQNVSLGFFLSYTDSTVQNPGETFPTAEGRHHVYVAMGRPWTTNAAVAPTIVQMDPVAEPDAGHVAVRFVHALAGAPGAVDVHVNGQTFSGLAFGQETGTITFPTRGAGQDSLYVMPAGAAPDPDTALWKNLGGSLFANGARYDCFLGHLPQDLYNGDAGGAIRLYQHSY